MKFPPYFRDPAVKTWYLRHEKEGTAFYMIGDENEVKAKLDHFVKSRSKGDLEHKFWMFMDAAKVPGLVEFGYVVVDKGETPPGIVAECLAQPGEPKGCLSGQFDMCDNAWPKLNVRYR